MVQDPLFAEPSWWGSVARAEAAGLRQMDPAQVLREAKRLLFTLIFEVAFKMGYL